MANQPRLHEAVAGLCAERDPVDRHETADHGLEADEVDVVAGHEGRPAAVATRGVRGSWKGPLPYVIRLIDANRSDPCNIKVA